MERMTAGQIAEAVGGRLLCGEGDIPVTDICTDSRLIKAGDLYVPVRGGRVDGHRFMAGAFAAGAAASFTSEHDTAEELEDVRKETGRTKDRHPAVIRVEDTISALQKLGKYCRNRLGIPFVGVTGSVGKTSTRAMIATALSSGLHTFQTAGNANSQVGVPITLSRIGEEYEAAVIELGMSQPGEMTRIASIAGLHVAVITNIGISHIEQLGSQVNILREKLHIMDGMREDGVLILNGDDPLLKPGADIGTDELAACVGRYEIRTYGLGEHNDYRASQVKVQDGRTVFRLCCPTERSGEKGEPYPGGELTVSLPAVGLHHVRNALAALACAGVMGLSIPDAAKALENFRGVAHRQEWVKLPALGISVIDDAYNASPDSMKAAFTALSMAQSQGRKMAVLADMWELGPETGRYHYEVGKALGETDVSLLATVGQLAGEIARGARETNPDLTVRCFEDRFLAGEWVMGQCREGDLVLFKGSNGEKLFEVVEKWKAMDKTETGL